MNFPFWIVTKNGRTSIHRSATSFKEAMENKPKDTYARKCLTEECLLKYIDATIKDTGLKGMFAEMRMREIEEEEASKANSKSD